MVKKIFLHMGAHKTGTTKLQADLALNRIQLQSIGLIYPEFNKANSHRQWARYLAGEMPGITALQHAKITSHWLNTMLPNQALLLSAEAFYRYVNTQSDYLPKLRLALGDADITPVLCLRGQADYVKSLYSEWVLNWWYPHDIYTFIKEFYSWFDFESVVLKISQLGEPILMSYHQIAGENLSSKFINQLGYTAKLVSSVDHLRVTPCDAEVYLKRLLSSLHPQLRFEKTISNAIKKVISESYPDLQVPMPKLIWHGDLDPVTFEDGYQRSNIRLCQQFNVDFEMFFPKTKYDSEQEVSAKQIALLKLAYHEVLQVININLANLRNASGVIP